MKPPDRAVDPPPAEAPGPSRLDRGADTGGAQPDHQNVRRLVEMLHIAECDGFQPHNPCPHLNGARLAGSAIRKRLRTASLKETFYSYGFCGIADSMEYAA